MADNRIEVTCGERRITIAVRHGDEWRSANDKDNDIGSFLNNVNRDSGFVGAPEIKISYERFPEYADPTLTL